MKAHRSRMGLFYVCLGAFSLGIMLQQTMLVLLVLAQIGAALVARQPLGALFRHGRWSGFILYAAIILSAMVAGVRYGDGDSSEFHWAFGALWVVGPSLLANVSWERVHRVMLALSIPGMIYSVYWLLQPDEIEWALQIGFSMYPRAEGFVSNPITNGELLAITACWSLCRLQTSLSRLERRLIWIHLCSAVLIVTMSRVRASVLLFVVVFLLTSLRLRRIRIGAIVLLLSTGALFGVATYVSGFNMDSLNERMVLIKHSLTLISENPVFGIGPNRFDIYPEPETQKSGHPHNTLLGITLESGAVGLIAYLIFLGMLSLSVWRLLQTQNEQRGPPPWVARSLALVFVVYLVAGLFDYNFADTELLIAHTLHWSIILQYDPKRGAMASLDATDTKGAIDPSPSPEVALVETGSSSDSL